MVSNNKSVTNQKDGLRNSLNLTNQDFYVRLVNEKNNKNSSVLAGCTFRAHFDFPPSLSTACHVSYNKGSFRPQIPEIPRGGEWTDTFRNFGFI